MTAHLSLCTQLKDDLAADLGNVATYLGRVRPLAQGSTGAVVVRPQYSVPASNLIGAPTDWQFTVVVECYGRGADEAGMQMADDIAQRVVASIDGNTAFRNIVGSIALVPGSDAIRWDFEQADSQLVCMTLRYQIQHRNLI